VFKIGSLLCWDLDPSLAYLMNCDIFQGDGVKPNAPSFQHFIMSEVNNALPFERQWIFGKQDPIDCYENSDKIPSFFEAADHLTYITAKAFYVTSLKGGKHVF
jgi:hypothetical protein